MLPFIAKDVKVKFFRMSGLRKLTNSSCTLAVVLIILMYWCCAGTSLWEHIKKLVFLVDMCD